MKCSKHGLERFRVKVVKRFNMHAEMIQPRFRSRPKPHGLDCIHAGRTLAKERLKNIWLIISLKKLYGEES